MRVLVLSEKEDTAEPFVNALKSKGVKASYLRLIKISLVSKHKNTFIKALEENIPKYDAVFLQARPSLAPFIEPLIETLNDQGIYCNVRPGSYFIAVNEPFKFVSLAANKVLTPRTITSGSGKNIERVSKKVAYPLLAKSFLGKDVQQSTIVKSDLELNNFVKSIKSDIDGFMLREFIDECIVSCVVIGKKVFAIDRRSGNSCVSDLEKGHFYKPREEERENAIRAANACGLDIAKVDLVKGRVIDVEPEIPLQIFNRICSDNLEEHIANFYIDKINEIGPKVTAGDELRELGTKLSKTILSRFLK